MTDAPVQMPTWSRQRWCVAIVFVLMLQAALVFLLERHSTVTRRKTVVVPLVRLRENIALETFAVSDPTVFVLPHQRGFSGEAWLNNLPSLDFQPAEWTEPPRTLSFASGALDANFQELVAANSTSPFETIATIEPAWSVPLSDPVETVRAESTLRIEGPLAQRLLLTPPQLPAWPSADLVTNSVVQLLVDAQGRAISPVLLAPGIRLKKQEEADNTALEMAKAAQFESVAPGTLTVGTMTFEWQTLPPASTNAPGEIP